jgi:hypothetical protein
MVLRQSQLLPKVILFICYLIQSSTQTHMDLWNSAMGDSFQFQHQNPSALSIQDSHCQIHSERTLVHKQPQDPRSEVKK